MVEAVGTTITAKIQGTLDTPDIADGSANWFDLPFITATDDTVASSLTKTATGAYPMWMSRGDQRFVRRVRVVTSANTGCTYHAEKTEQWK